MTHKPDATTRLPDEWIVPVRPRRALTVWIAPCLILAAINLSAIPLLDRYAPNPFAHVPRIKWSLLENAAGPGENLILGDSAGNQGVDPALLEPRLGGSWLNLCTVANLMTLDDAWMLNRYVERHGAPQRVIVVHVLDSWERPIHAGAFAQVPLPWGFWNRVDPPLRLSLKKQLELTGVRYAPLYSADQSLRFMLMYPWRVPETWPDIDSRGFMPMPESTPEEATTDLERLTRMLEEGEGEPSPANVEGMKRLLTLSSEHDFPLYFAWGPMWEKMWERELTRERFASMHASLLELAEGHDRFHMVFDEPMRFPLERIQTVGHVTADGAQAYTREIASRIRSMETAGNGGCPTLHRSIRA